MLLLASVVFGRAGAEEAFQFLPEEEAELLTHRFGAFRSIPKEQRIPFLVREMRRMLSMRRRRLATADPKHLAGLLAKEKPVVTQVILRALPAPLAHSVQKALPGFRAMQLYREPRAEVLSIVRWKLEEELQNSSVSAHFRFEDLMGLQARELITVCDRMGARVFATALAGLPSGERQNFFAALPPDQRMLAQRACDVAKTQHLQAKDARRLLELYGATEDPSAAIRSAGIRRIMKACLAESSAFASTITRRYEGELGGLLLHWLEKEKGKQVRGDGGRADILEQLEFLARRGFLERPLILPKPGVLVARLFKPKEPDPSLGPARQAESSLAKSPRLSSQKLLAPTPSKLVHLGSHKNAAVVSPARSHSERLSKPQAAKRLVPSSSSSQVADTKRLSLASPKTAGKPSSLKAARQGMPKSSGIRKDEKGFTGKSALARMPTHMDESSGHRVFAKKPIVTHKSTHENEPSGPKIFTGKSAVARMPAPTDEPVGHKGFTGKSAVVRVPALQSVPRRRTAEEANPTKRKDDKPIERYRAQEDVGEKPNRKR